MKDKVRPRPRVTLIVETASASGRNIARGITRYARPHGPWILHHEWRNTDMYFPPWLRAWEGDGIIARIESRKIANSLKRLRVPVVDVLGTLQLARMPVVRVDDKAIGRMAAQDLLQKGFRNFGYCGLKEFWWSSTRGVGFVEALRGEGHECAVNEWAPRPRTPWFWDRAQDSMVDWLRQLPKPVGLMLCHDHHGHFVQEACRRGGLAMPDEVAIIGVDDDESICEICDPPLSSVIPDDDRVGWEAARLLDSLLHGGRWNGKSILVPPKGVRTRLSTDVLAVNDAQVAAAAGFIREHACAGIRVQDVVRAIPLSRTLLQNRFRQNLGRTIHDEIERVRLQHARFLLEEGDMPISLVAEKSGFKHQAYLGAVFKKKFGRTPLQYRKSQRLA